MLPENRRRLAINILALILVAVFSIFVLTTWLPETNFIETALERVTESRHTVTKFSAATLSMSLGISALPGDFGSPLAENLADMNLWLGVILAVLVAEELLIRYGIKLAFTIAIPVACGLGILSLLLKKDCLKSLAIRVTVLGLAVALVVPCSTHLADYVAADLRAEVETTISNTEEGADLLNEAAINGTDEKSLFDKLSDLFQTVINDVSQLVDNLRNAVTNCLYAIAILFLTDFVMPLVNFFILRWVLKETFQIVIPTPQRRRRHSSDSEFYDAEFEYAGEVKL